MFTDILFPVKNVSVKYHNMVIYYMIWLDIIRSKKFIFKGTKRPDQLTLSQQPSYFSHPSESQTNFRSDERRRKTGHATRAFCASGAIGEKWAVVDDMVGLTSIQVWGAGDPWCVTDDTVDYDAIEKIHALKLPRTSSHKAHIHVKCVAC